MSGGVDELGLRRAMSDRMLPLLVGAMAFLAALSMTGLAGSAALSQHWQDGAGGSLTVQVPRPQEAAAGGGGTRLARVLAVLAAAPGVASARALSDGELADLLRPWLGQAADRIAIPVPAVVAVRLAGPGGDSGAGAVEGGAGLAARLEAAAPGTLMEDHGIWVRRLGALARSLQACAALAVLLVAGSAALVIVVATRAGLAARRAAIEIVHGLGATDSFIAGRFAWRATVLAATGAAFGAVAAVPVLLLLARLAAPFGGQPSAGHGSGAAAGGWATDLLTALPMPLWLALAALPAGAAAIGYGAAHVTVRGWLRRLP
jgi:cell division transport system permease protein